MKTVDYDVEPSLWDTRRLAHIHVRGKCIKNRYGVRCG